MAIIRKDHIRNYTVVDNEIIRETRLSLKAKGMMLILLSLPDNWRFSEDWLVTQASDGKTAVRAALHELEALGYLKRHREHRDGKLRESIYEIYEQPHDSDFQTLENQNFENRKLLNTNNNEILSINNTLSESSNSDIERIVSYLNRLIGSHYRATTPKTRSLIQARLKEGFSLDDFKTVIDTKVDDWLNRKDMAKYLRPETLFGTKFEGYLNERRDNREEEADTYEYFD